MDENKLSINTESMDTVQTATKPAASVTIAEVDHDEMSGEAVSTEFDGTNEENAGAQTTTDPSNENGASEGAQEERTLDVVSLGGETFESLNISKPILDGLKFIGYRYPSPVQVKAIPPGLAGHDLIIQSKAGTGKTCVFVVTALEVVNTALSDELQVIVVTVTPEVCFQVHETFRKIGRFKEGLRCFYIVGGSALQHRVSNLKKVQIVIGTIGCLCHLIKNGHLPTDFVKLLVFDELDKLQEESAIENFNWIFHHLRSNKQIITASATYPTAFQQCLFPYMRDPCLVQLSSNNDHLIGMKEYVIVNKKRHVCTSETRMDALAYLLKEVAFEQCIVFTNYQTRVQQIAAELNKRGVKAMTVSGAANLQARMDIIRQLLRGNYRLIVTTDLYARGVDLPSANLVINVEVPINWSTYAHRIGRAGRFGRHAAAVTLICQHRDSDDFFSMAQGHFSFFKILPMMASRDLVTNVGFYDKCTSCDFGDATPTVLWMMLRNFNASIELNPSDRRSDIAQRGSNDTSVSSIDQRADEGEVPRLLTTKGGQDAFAGLGDGQRRPQGKFKSSMNRSTGQRSGSVPLDKTQFLLSYLKANQFDPTASIEANDENSRCYSSRVFCCVLYRCLQEDPPANPEVSALMESLSKKKTLSANVHNAVHLRGNNESKQTDKPKNAEATAEVCQSDAIAEDVVQWDVPVGNCEISKMTDGKRNAEKTGTASVPEVDAANPEEKSKAAFSNLPANLERCGAPSACAQEEEERNVALWDVSTLNVQLSQPALSEDIDHSAERSHGVLDLSSTETRKSEEATVSLGQNVSFHAHEEQVSFEPGPHESVGRSQANCEEVNGQNDFEWNSFQFDSPKDGAQLVLVEVGPTMNAESDVATKMSDGKRDAVQRPKLSSTVQAPLEVTVNGTTDFVLNSNEDGHSCGRPACHGGCVCDTNFVFERQFNGMKRYIEYMMEFPGYKV